MRRRITAFFIGAAVLATLTTGQAAMAAPAKKTEFPSSYPYTARVFTANAPDAGSDSLVLMRLYGSDNYTTGVSLGTNHVQGQIAFNDFHFTRYLGRIDRICVYKTATGTSPSWRLGSIQINGTRAAEFYQWIPDNMWTCANTHA